MGAKPMTAKFDVSTLNWVKGEIDESLNQARIALEAFVNTPEDENQMGFCVMHLHQVHGTLQMVELYGAASAAEEMERLAVALQEKRVDAVERASEVLMRAILQLPDYLEALQGGQDDNAVVLLPVINELRRLRGEQPLSESTFFQPDLTVMPETAPASTDIDIRALAQKLRPYYQSSLLHLLRGEDMAQSLKTLRAIGDKLLAVAQQPPVRQWCWIFGGFVEAIAEQAQTLREATKPLLSKGEQTLKLLGEQGEAGYNPQTMASQLTSMLFQVSQARGSGSRIAELKQTFHLDNLLAAAPAAAGPGRLGGFNAELKKTLAADVLEELSTVQDALDIFVRSEQRVVSGLLPMADTMERLASTLVMMGQDSLQQTLIGQVSTIRGLQESPDDETLMGIASAVLAVESALRDWGTVRPLEQADDLNEQVATLSPEAEAEHQRVIRQVMKEAKSNLLRVKDAVDTFVAAPETAAPLEPVAGLLHEIIGSLALLSYKRVAQVLRACSLYIDEVLAKGPLPPAEHLDALADALTSVEYYLDAFVESRVHPGMVLEVAERAVALLGYPVENLPSIEQGAESVSGAPAEIVEQEEAGESEEIELTIPALEEEMVEITASTEPAVEEELSAEAFTLEIPEEEEIELAPPPAAEEPAEPLVELEPAPVPEPPAAAPPAATTLIPQPAPRSDDLDEEIVEIFIEEAQEEISKINELLPRWQSNRNDQEALRDLRRSFHTLKGSGRLVGASTIGEFAWAFENMLNRVIDKTIDTGNAMFDLLDQAREALAELVEQFRSGALVSSDIEWLAQAADAMAEPGGIEALLQQSAPAAKAAPAPEPVAAVGTPVEALTEAAAEAELDPVLLEIYGNETEGHLAEIETFIGDCREHGACRVSETLTRALHTLQGSSRMAGVIAVADVAIHLEKYAKAIHTAHASVAEDGLDALHRCVVFSRDMLAFLQGNGAERPDSSALQVDAEALHEMAHRLAEGLEAVPEADLAKTPEAAPEPEDMAAAVPEVEEIVVEELPTLEEEIASLLPAEPLAEEEEIVLAAPEEEEGPSLEDILSSIEFEPLPETPPVEEVEATAIPEEAPAPLQPEAPVAPPPVVQEYDQELLDIFLEEGAEILDASEQTLQNWVEHPEDGSLVEELQRQLHTLKGGARMAGVTAIGDLSHTLESIFEDVVEGRITRSKAMMDLLQLAHDRLERMLEQVRNNQPLSSGDDLIARIHALAGGVQEIETVVEPAAPEPVVLEPVPELEFAAAPESVSPFVAMAEEWLEVCDFQLRAWLVEEDKQPLLREMSAQLGALEAGALEAGVPAIAELSKAALAMLQAVTDGHVPVSERLFAMLQRVYDRLNVMVDHMRSGAAVVDSAPELAVAMDELVTEYKAQEEAPVAEPAAPAPLAESLAVEEEALDKGGERRQAQRVQQEMVRVRSDLLDNLVNYAGEVSIYRSRVEQQVGSVNHSLRDFDEILERLREQLRQFSIETEAQIQSRYEEAAREGYDEFDPLEFDRFTHMQQLTRSTMESLADLEVVQDTVQGLTRETETLLLQQARVNTELQEGLMHTRMVPLVENAPRLRRIVRQTCAELGKEVEIRFQGAEVEMDRHMVERMLAPIEHLLRNAIAHGIETPEERRKTGKRPSGQITIAQAREGSEVVIRVIDDGAGINLDRVRRKAIERGLMKADAGLSDKEVMHFILESGFSTAESLTQLAGRGVGMDVVNSEIKQLGGALEIDTKTGEGTTFTVRLPLTLSVTRALLVQSGDEIYAVPLASIQGIERIDRGKLEQMLAVETPVYHWLNQEYELLSLGGVLGVNSIAVADEIVKRPLLFAHSGDHYVAWAADNLLGSREIVVKSLGPQLSTLRGLSGATILGDGRVALILDLPLLARLGLAQRSHVVEEIAPEQEVQPLVMVVDDSITVRKVTTRLLERNDLRAVTAKDGVDAIAQLEDVMPDVMLLDIEMPRMDGYELATHIRNTERLKHIPIIMITSRSGEKHRQRALEIGVDMYMGKPYQETELLGNIRKLIAERRGG